MLLFDSLFDTYNGMSVRPYSRKFFRMAIHSQSKHINFWKKTLPILQTMCFINKKGKLEKCLKNSRSIPTENHNSKN